MSPLSLRVARRLYGPVVLATLATGGLAFFAASRTWVHARVLADGLPDATIEVTGKVAQPIIPALALVVVTAALAVLASSRRVRRVVGGFTVLVAVVGIVLVVTGGSALDDALRQAVEESPSFTGTNMPDAEQHMFWRLVTGIAFALAAMLGAITVRFGPIWPTMSSRYDAPKAHSDAAVVQSDADMWKALDEGHDPTQ